MPAHELGERVHHDIGAVLDRAQQHRRGHGVIHHEWDAVPVRHLRQRLDIADVAGRIAYALAVDGARLGVDEALDSLRTVGLGKAHRHALPRQNMREQRVRRAVELRRRDDVAAHAGEVEHRVVHRGLAGGHAYRLQSAFERRHAPLQHGSGGIADARVAVALDFQVEQRRGVLGAVESVGHGLVDGYRNRARSGVGLVTSMNGDCFAFHRDSNVGECLCAAVVRSAGAIVLIATAAPA